MCVEVSFYIGDRLISTLCVSTERFENALLSITLPQLRQCGLSFLDGDLYECMLVRQVWNFLCVQRDASRVFYTSHKLNVRGYSFPKPPNHLF
jgi:hypothetical protein